MEDLIFISIEPWDDVWRRNQFVTQRLARRHPDSRILFVNPPADVSHAVRRGKFGQAVRQLVPEMPVALDDTPNLLLFTPVKPFPNSLALGRKINESMARVQVRRAARTLGMSRAVLWINPHYAAHLAGRMNELGVIYDVGEDWSAMPGRESVRRRIVAEDERLSRRADAIIVCSPNLMELKRPFGSKVQRIHNGVDVERYHPICEKTLPAHPLTHGWPRPVLGHTGTIHSDRTDVELTVAIARAFPQGTLALVGPDHLREADRSRLLSEPNVKLTGPVKNTELPQMMTAFDVCLVPHRVDAFSESQNPLKLFEYLASGLPIVSTPIAGFRDYPELVRLARGPEAFAEAIRQALVEPETLRDLRRQAARPHTWDACVDRIEAIIDRVAQGNPAVSELVPC